jgi:undecaprenyl-diphosphatase
MIPLIIVATIPTAIIGLIYVEFLESTLQQLLIIGTTFIIGATLVYTSKLGKETTETITVPTALIMGIAQGLAIFPGLSRSGQIALSGIGNTELLIAILITIIVGYISIRIVSKVVRSKKFHYFAIYTWLLGITLITLTLSGF